MVRSLKFLTLLITFATWFQVAWAESLDLYDKCGSSRANRSGINRDRLIDFEIRTDLQNMGHPDFAFFGDKSIGEAKADRNRVQKEILICIEEQVRENNDSSLSKVANSIRKMRRQASQAYGDTRAQIHQCMNLPGQSDRAKCLRQSYGAWLEARLVHRLTAFLLMKVSEDDPDAPSDKDQINDMFKIAKASLDRSAPGPMESPSPPILMMKDSTAAN